MTEDDRSSERLDDEGIANDFLAVYLDDVANGNERSLAGYQALFPGHDELIAVEHARLVDEDATGPEPPAPPKPSIPDVTLEDVLGRGGQGTVWRGRQAYVERSVAVKLLAQPWAEPELAARFQREAKILAGMSHPHIVTCYSAGTTEEGVGYIVMELIEGPNLRRFVHENGPLPVAAALRLTRDLARALECGAREGIVHRDVKPENVLLQPSADGGDFAFVAKLADLGLARPMQSSDAALTQTKQTLGTPPTMAPEQFDDPENVDERADMYGLGCVLFLALTGKPAFAKFADRLGNSLPDVDAARPGLPRAVRELVTCLLQPKREDRPGDYAALIAMCDAALRQFAPRRKHWFALAAVLIVAAAGVALWQSNRSPPAPPAPLLVSTVQERAAREGERVVLTSELVGPWASEVARTWSQASGPAVLLEPSADGRELRFVAPRGLAQAELVFEVKAQSGEEARSARTIVRVSGDTALAPLAAGDERALFHEDFDRALEGWSGNEDDAWAGSPDGIGVQGMTSDRASLLWRALPRGDWRLVGKVIPQSQDARVARASIRLELSCGNAVELALQPSAGAGYVARLLHVQREGASWRERESFASATAAWSLRDPLEFTFAWSRGKLRCEFAGVAHVVAISGWKTPYPPALLTLSLEKGLLTFSDFVLSGG